MPIALSLVTGSLALAASVGFQAPTADALEALDHAALNARLRALEARRPDRCAIVPIGRSREGREILAARLAIGEVEARPAILVVANLEGPDVFDGAVALHLAETLADRDDDGARALLESTTLYVLPRLAVDAAEARFETPRHERLGGGRGVDDDRDGREGEDPPSDVDGDGLIASLRKQDPEGEWIEDPRDARVLVKADRNQGERGRFKLFVEGRDLDSDENVGEDGPRDTWLNRNFPHGWKEHDPRAGLFPTDEPEARALVDFVLLRKDVAMVVAYGSVDTLAAKPKIGKEANAPPTGWIESDVDALAKLRERYGELVEGALESSNGDEGTFQGWAYHHRGLWVLGARLWDIPLDAKKPADGGDGEKKDRDGAESKQGDAKAKAKKREPSDDAKRLAWIDAQGESARFVPWKPFAHPELGDVEIGGLAPFARREPPAKDRAGIAEKQLAFLLELGAKLPRIRFAACDAKPLGEGLFEVRAALENGALLPLSSASARRNQAIRPARVELELAAGATLIAGERVRLVSELAGSGGRRELVWIVAAPSAQHARVRATTDHAGHAVAQPEVVR